MKHGGVHHARGRRLKSRQRLAAAFGQFLVELGQNDGRVQFQGHGVGAHESPDINRRGKNIIIALVNGADMVAADFGHVRDLCDREPLGLARRLQLFANRCHIGELIAVLRRTGKGAVS